MKRQSAKTGSKRWFSGGFPEALERWIIREARRDGVSYSFVLHNCARIVSGIEAETYDKKPERRTNLVSFSKVMKLAVKGKVSKRARRKVRA